MLEDHELPANENVPPAARMIPIYGLVVDGGRVIRIHAEAPAETSFPNDPREA